MEYKEGPLGVPCEEFVRTVDVCKLTHASPLVIACGPSGRVTMLVGRDRSQRPTMDKWSLSPSLAMMDQLEELKLIDMGLTGILPPEWARLSKLKELNVSCNQLEGTLPVSFKGLSNIQVLGLFNNTFQGTLPPEWGQLTKVSMLYLYDNQLTGQLPASWSGLNNIKDLRLQINRLEGPLPPQWGNLTSLTTWLNLRSNALQGTLPPEWSQLRHLHRLSLRNNILHGTLPPEWGQLTNLNLLYLFKNRLNGQLPASWGGMRDMTDLQLQGNSLEGTIPAQWSQLNNLISLSLANNTLNGSLAGAMIAMPTGARASENWVYSEVPIPKQLQQLVSPKRLSKMLGIEGTSIPLPFYMTLNSACQDYQRQKVTLFITYGKGEVWWCGKTRSPEFQVALLWGTFGVVATAIFWWQGWGRHGRKTQRRGLTAAEKMEIPAATAGPDACLETGTDPLSLHQQLQRSSASRSSFSTQRSFKLARSLWARYVRVPLHVVLCLVDIISDVLLAVNMYPSWTFYTILVGFFIPDLVCSLALAVGSMKPMRSYGLPHWATYPAAVVVFVVLVATLPVLLVLLTIASLWHQGRRPAERWWLVNLKRVLLLMSGVTACTEDILTAAFSSLGFILMSHSPANAVNNRVYFPLWSFWTSVPFSLLHMALAWWDAVGNWRKHGNLSWIPAAFHHLYWEEVEGSNVACARGHAERKDPTEVQEVLCVVGGDDFIANILAAAPGCSADKIKVLEEEQVEIEEIGEGGGGGVPSEIGLDIEVRSSKESSAEFVEWSRCSPSS